MCTFEYISLDDDHGISGTHTGSGCVRAVSGRLCESSRRKRNSQKADERARSAVTAIENENYRKRGGKKEKGRRRRRKDAFGFSWKGRMLIGAVIIAAGTVTAWGLRGSMSGEATWGRRIIEHYDTGASETELLMLVNKDHPLPEDYEPVLHWLNNGSCAVAEEMYGPLKEMLTDGSREGLEFVVASGYRDSAYQQQLLDEDIQAAMESEGLTWDEAYAQETRETMPPGYSEHGTGLAADIVALDYQVLDEAQESTPENQWLRENCSRYGFILRYPRGTEHITGIDYEAWHFRYVGKEVAEEITRRGITLEEFLGKA